MTKQEYIYRVSFKEHPIPQYGLEYNTQNEFFFTSLSAIYETFTPEQIGCKVERLWNLKITPDKPYIGRKCRIFKSLLASKKQANAAKRLSAPTSPDNSSLDNLHENKLKG
ncbi:MAG: hypothetical protein ACRCZB_06050 [Bacteroidales bacterium]